jgi:hypothetical protein
MEAMCCPREKGAHVQDTVASEKNASSVNSTGHETLHHQLTCIQAGDKVLLSAQQRQIAGLADNVCCDDIVPALAEFAKATPAKCQQHLCYVRPIQC